MILRPWPSWHPDQELKADHLLGLEDYLLARVLMVDEGAFGVDLKDWKASLQIMKSESGFTIKVHRLRGSTRAGQPIWLQTDDLLETNIEGPSRGDIAFDLWVVINNPSKDAAKLTLRANPVPTADFPPVKPAKNPDTLYLGRYRGLYRAGEPELELIHRPLPRRLGGFGPVGDAAWQQWVRPLTARLEDLLREVAGRSDRNAASLAVAAELTRVNFEWPSLPVPILARRLRMISWLREFSRNPALVPDPAAAMEPFPRLDEVTGDALPQELAGLIPFDLKESGGLGQSFRRLLDELLPDRGVDYHAPLAALREWAEYLEGAQPLLPSSEDAVALVRDVEDALTGRSQRGALNEWARIVALITVLNVRTNTGWEGPQRGLEFYLGPDVRGADDGAARTLEALYLQTAEEARAGPLAFYWIARAAARQLDTAKLFSIDVRVYFQTIVGSASEPRRNTTAGTTRGVERVVNFLARTKGQAAAGRQLQPYIWSRKYLAGPDRRGAAREVQITVVGGPGSGKTTLIREFVRACRDAVPIIPGANLQIVVPGHLGENAPCEVEGQLILDGRTLGIRIVDAGSLSPPPDEWARETEWPPLWRAIALSDLLIITIEPAAIDRIEAPPDLPRLRKLAEWTLERRSAALVAIAYAKADEYGVVEPQVLRIVNDDSQAQRLEALRSAADVDKAWTLFVEGGVTTSRQEQRVGGGIFGTRRANSQLDEGDWVPTRKKVLDQTRPLWEAVVRRTPPALLNGYFVSANPRDPYLEPWPNRGILQIFADFLHCLRGSTQ